MNAIGEIEMPVKRWWRLLHETGWSTVARAAISCFSVSNLAWSMGRSSNRPEIGERSKNRNGEVSGNP